MFSCNFGEISTCKFFKDYKLHLPYWLVQFVVFEKLTRAYKHQIIVLEVMLLPILLGVGGLVSALDSGSISLRPGGVNVLCSWAKCFTFTAPLCTQE